jgi:hypothetical protein
MLRMHAAGLRLPNPQGNDEYGSGEKCPKGEKYSLQGRQ